MALPQPTVVADQSNAAQLALGLANKRSQDASNAISAVGTGFNALGTVAGIGQTIYTDIVEANKEHAMQLEKLLTTAGTGAGGKFDPMELKLKAFTDPTVSKAMSDLARYRATGRFDKDLSSTDAQDAKQFMSTTFKPGWEKIPALVMAAGSTGGKVDAADRAILADMSATLGDQNLVAELGKRFNALSTQPAEEVQAQQVQAAGSAPSANVAQPAQNNAQDVALPAGPAMQAPQQPVVTLGAVKPIAAAAVGQAGRVSGVGGMAKTPDGSNLSISRTFDPDPRVAAGTAKATPETIAEAQRVAKSEFAKMFKLTGDPAALAMLDKAWTGITETAEARTADAKLAAARIMQRVDPTVTPDTAVEKLAEWKRGLSYTALSNFVTQGQMSVPFTSKGGVITREIFMPPKQSVTVSRPAPGPAGEPALRLTGGSQQQVQTAAGGELPGEEMTAWGANASDVAEMTQKVMSGQPLNMKDLRAQNAVHSVGRQVIKSAEETPLPNGGTWGDLLKVSRVEIGDVKKTFMKLNGLNITPTEFLSDPSVNTLQQYTDKAANAVKLGADQQALVTDVVKAYKTYQNTALNQGYSLNAAGGLVALPEFAEKWQFEKDLENRKMLLQEKQYQLQKELTEGKYGSGEGAAKAAQQMQSSALIIKQLEFMKEVDEATIRKFGKIPDANDSNYRKFLAEEPQASMIASYKAALQLVGSYNKVDTSNAGAMIRQMNAEAAAAAAAARGAAPAAPGAAAPVPGAADLTRMATPAAAGMFSNKADSTAVNSFMSKFE